MNIELTKDQYKTLLMLMYCGEWVLNCYKLKEDRVYIETDKFEQYIFAFAKEFKLEKMIVYNEMSKKYFPTAFMEQSFHKYIDRYDTRNR